MHVFSLTSLTNGLYLFFQVNLVTNFVFLKMYLLLIPSLPPEVRFLVLSIISTFACLSINFKFYIYYILFLSLDFLCCYFYYVSELNA